MLNTGALLSGLGTGLSLIVAIGAQNAFVLKQGLLRQHVLAVCLFCAASDALLIALGWTPGLPPAALAADAAGEAHARAAFKAEAEAALAFAPPYDQWLARALQSSRAPAG